MRKDFKRLFSVGLFCLSVGIFAQQKPITGQVVDSDGFPVQDAYVYVEGNEEGVYTDADGNYMLNAQPGDKVVVEFIGYDNKIINVSNADTYNVELSKGDGAIELKEIVQIGYGTANKESLVGSAGILDAEDLEKRSVTSVAQAFEGASSGVQVTSSGQPGAEPGVRIRGFGTLNGDASPLYVVDGVQYEGSLANLNMADVESITFLKDASSTAIYGARAANGIVMITTKKGKGKGDINVDVKMETGVVTRGLPVYETVGAKPYYELMFQAYKNSLIHASGKTEAEASALAARGIFNQLQYNPFDVANDNIVGADGRINPSARLIYPSLNWYEPLERTGYRVNNNVAFSGAGEKHDFYVSLGYTDEKGYVIKSDYNRVNGRFNINMTPKDWFKFGTNMAANLTKQGLISESGNGYSNPFRIARYMGPIYPVYVVEPGTGKYILGSDGQRQYDLGGGYTQYGINARPSDASPGRHVIAELNYNDNQTKTNNISNRSYLELNLIDGLKFSTNVGLDIDNYYYKEYENKIVGDGSPEGRYNEIRYTRTVLNLNQLINYTKTFGDHSIEILLGHESFDRNFSRISGSKQKGIVEGIYEFDNFVTPLNLGGYSTDKRNEGYFSRLKYNYAGRYYVEGSFRRDGSSVFAKENRWGNFFSVGGAWRLDREEFLIDNSWINQLKLRASYGEVGNDRIGNFYASRPLYESYPNSDESGLRWAKIGNKELTWESNNSFDVGLDFGFFSNRVSGSVEFYKKISEDLLYDMPLPLSLGLAVQPRNIASLYNQGWELGLNVDIIRGQEFKWSAGVQASTVKNEITSIPSDFINGSKRWAAGHSVYDYYLYQYYGVNPDNGAPLFYVLEKDAEGETHRVLNADGTPKLTENISETERGYTGDSSIPDVFGSFSNQFSYKGFTLDFLFTYGIGGKVLDFNYARLMNGGDYGEALHVDMQNAWRKPGDVTNIPRLQNGNTNIGVGGSTQWLTDASYLSLKNVNLGYSISDKILETLSMKSLRFYVSGENLFILSKRKGMDPQQGFSGTTSNVYLPARTISLGVNLSF